MGKVGAPAPATCVWSKLTSEIRRNKEFKFETNFNFSHQQTIVKI